MHAKLHVRRSICQFNSCPEYEKVFFSFSGSVDAGIETSSPPAPPPLREHPWRLGLIKANRHIARQSV